MANLTILKATIPVSAGALPHGSRSLLAAMAGSQPIAVNAGFLAAELDGIGLAPRCLPHK
jgi:hypothetical protein